MKDLTAVQYITALRVLEEHQPAEYSWGVDGCTCNASVEFGQQAEHQMREIVKALREGG
ncbi:hypothetical protein PBI_RUFUS_66 [Mycobacterium phage Rufus]|nr:hypothetical protein AVV03_gp66 [Mycobacterium phage Rufus]ALA46430.1 hypothetical protein PBI_RUFUS_66 [Mycobacterium phage Rufus]QRI44883.1 hypothetical protein SEA_RUBEUS_63 [Mycobacterium phage Rubeus]WNM72191.1 hypothetical protein SEA_ASHBALLER_67 [Mycobacterium phage Ashballer]WNO26556.1 hypothetical protein SEA_DEXES_64 [Mycobacterium phage Dexes]